MCPNILVAMFLTILTTNHMRFKYTIYYMGDLYILHTMNANESRVLPIQYGYMGGYDYVFKVGNFV